MSNRSDENKGFLARWSDRKQAHEQEEEQKPIQARFLDEGRETKGSADEEFEDKTDAEIISILDLPEPESLKLGDNVAGFMSDRVPERIRAKALRAFWKTNPVLANIDGLDEYCDDYTDAAMIIENMQTIYQVGKGYASQALDALESLSEEDVDKITKETGVDQPALPSAGKISVSEPSEELLDANLSDPPSTDSKSWDDTALRQTNTALVLPNTAETLFDEGPEGHGFQDPSKEGARVKPNRMTFS